MKKKHTKILPRICLLLTTTCLLVIIRQTVVCDPQTNLLNYGCSQYNATNLGDFYDNLNATFTQIGNQLLNDDKRFATGNQSKGSDPVYAMVQCRNYLSKTDCVDCFETARKQIRNCSAANGARVIYDGCFLRYESNIFFNDKGTLPGNVGVCGQNRTTFDANAFEAAAGELLTDLEVATPKIDGYFAAAASKKQGDGNGGVSVYGVAQCAETLSQSDCQECLNVGYGNIDNCPPNSNGRAVDAGCFMRFSDTPFFADNQTIDLTPYLNNGGSSEKKAIIGGVVGGVVGVLLLILIALFVWFKQRKQKTAPRGDILGATELRGPMNYRYNDLKSATKNFSQENKLGEGGFGDVYKGVLKNGKVVAVKKLAIVQSNRAKLEFDSEVKLISNVHHRNLVRLLGCCNERKELLLVYEYMANSSLDKFLFGDKRGSLNWKQRFDVILGTARGLAYLHEEFHVCVIHRDIKSSNILLGDDFQPKIADFGLARLLPQSQTHLSTKFAGTLGYTAPEYAIHGQLSEKVDTYSYGVVVLEIVSGQKSSESQSGLVDEFLLKRAWKLYENKMQHELIDKSIDSNEYEKEDVKRIIEIALMCTQSSPSSRPTMSEVVVLLKSKGSSMERRPLTRPILVDSEAKPPADTSTSGSSSASNATASFSQVSAR